MSCFSTWCRNNASLLYFSLSSKSVIIFANYCFTSIFKAVDVWACMLTNPLSLLSKPVSPIIELVTYRKKQSLYKTVSIGYKKSPRLGELLRSGRDSNSRPHAWQACILTDWTTGPRFLRTLFVFVCECKDTTFFHTDQIFFEKKFHFSFNILIIKIKIFAFFWLNIH